MPKQKQKQKQTVIVNIGDKVARRRRRKRVGKAKPRPPDAPQAPRPQFVQTLYPVSNPIQSEQLQFNLANINKQLQTLQDKQLNATANLMSGIKAIEREEKTLVEMETQSKPAPAPARGRDETKRKKKIIIREPVADLAPPKPPPSPVAPPESSPSPLAPRGRSSSRKVRTDRGVSRGPSLKTAMRDAQARGSSLVSLNPDFVDINRAAAEETRGFKVPSL